MHRDQVQLEDGCLDGIQQLPHDTAAVKWKLSEWLPTEQLERVEPEDNLVDLGPRLGSAGNGKEPICWRIELIRQNSLQQACIAKFSIR